jgi:cysteine synthase B
MARRIAREGLLLGVSAAAGLVGGLEVAERHLARSEQPAVIVTILCDSGDKYLSERFWTE